MKKNLILTSLLIVLFFVGCNETTNDNNTNKQVEAKNENINIVAEVVDEEQQNDIESEFVLYENDKYGFSVEYPSNWQVIEDYKSYNTPNITFLNQDFLYDNHAVIYVRTEEKLDSLSINDWLNSGDIKNNNKYMSQQKHNEIEADEEIVVSGQYSEENVYINNIKGLKQNVAGEGGGYLRFLLPTDNKIIVVTAWSDSYYFNENNSPVLDKFIETFTLK